MNGQHAQIARDASLAASLLWNVWHEVRAARRVVFPALSLLAELRKSVPPPAAAPTGPALAAAHPVVVRPIVRPKPKEPTMSFFSQLLPILEPAALSLIAGAANSSTPLSAIDPTHPLASAAADVAVVAGKAAAVELPQAAALAPLLLQMAQLWVTANTPAAKPAAAS